MSESRLVRRYGPRSVTEPESPATAIAYAPLDEALARFVVDFSGRPYLEFVAVMPEPVIGVDFASSLVEEFWRAVAVNGGLTVHIDLIRARNAHHAAEAIFKSAAVALRMASRITRDTDVRTVDKGHAGMIAIIDYGAGNLRSIRRALETNGAETVITERSRGRTQRGRGRASRGRTCRTCDR